MVIEVIATESAVAENNSYFISTRDNLCKDPVRGVIIPISQMGKQTYLSCSTCPGPKSKRIQTQTCLTGKPGIWPHLTLRLLQGASCHPTLPTGPELGRQAIPLFPFCSLLGPGCPLAASWPTESLSMLSIASLPCGPAPGSRP